MSVSYWNDQSKGQNLNVDIAIIGGGISGLSCAYWLQKEDPSLRIAIIEKYEIGAGASGRNAGFVTCGSVEHFNRLVGKQESTKLMSAMKINVEELGQKDIEKRLGAAKFVGGIKYCDDASVHPMLLLRGMKKKLGKNVFVLEQHEVHSIQTKAENKLVLTNKTNIEASMVVYATNGYSPLLHDYFSTKVFPTRAQIMVTEPVPRFMEGPCYANFVLDYFRQLPTGEMIIGGFRQLQKDVEKGYSDETSDVIQKALEHFLLEHIPAIRNAKVTHRWSGIMGFSVDGQPLVGSLPEDPQLLFACGYTGHGLGLAFHSAKVLTDCIFGRNIPKFISAKRFT